MKNLLLHIFFAFLFSSNIAKGQNALKNSRCEVVRQLIEKAATKQLGNEARETIANDDLETWKATTKMPGATNSIIQDAFTTKAYTAEFGIAFSKEKDNTLTEQYNNLVNEFKSCFKNEFKENVISPSEGIFNGTMMEGLGKYANISVNFFQLYNPAEKKQYVSLTIMYDPD